MKLKIYIGLIFVATVAMILPFPHVALAEEEVFIIANKNVPASSLSYDEVRDIFLSKKTRWDTGHKIIIATLTDNRAHKSFLNTYIKKSPSQFQRYYRSLVFSGKGEIPKSFRTPESLLKFVTHTDGAIGYVPSQMTSDDVKIILTN